MKDDQSRSTNRFALIYLYCSIALVTFAALRFSLFLVNSSDLENPGRALLPIMGKGLIADATVCSWAALAACIYIWLAPRRIRAMRVHRWLLASGFFLALFLLLFEVASEWFFWEEFSARFNFIAVDYLIYTTEVIGNIRESYPMPVILTGLLALSVGIFWVVRTPLNKSLIATQQGSAPKWQLLILMLLPAMQLANLNAPPANGNRYKLELQKNGMASFVGAFRANTLSYDQYYRQMDHVEGMQRLHTILGRDGGTRVHPEDPMDITRHLEAEGAPIKRNVVLVTIESLSANFLGSYGNALGLTPVLDALSKESKTYTRMFATGTRTVRGLEALTLSVPPTPGRSIVKRPNCGNLFSLGSVFRSKGYKTHFIYGGYGYFDNMNAFFDSNGYAVTDRHDIKSENIRFTNAWGVCDEDLYDQTIRECDESHKQGKPFFAHVMTTTNHRPYTYPDVIDLPPGHGRHGAVKYTDYAIGQFLEHARTKPWFSNTLFIFVADHCSSSAGRTEIALSKYHIPILFYGPGFVEPGANNRLASMLDIGPTILGMLNFSYDTRFFGHDLQSAGRDLVLLGNYQTLGLLTNDSFVMLRPRQIVECYSVSQSLELTPAPEEELPELIKDATTLYQCASDLWDKGRMRLEKPVNAAHAL